jgi:hypothetical protein
MDHVADEQPAVCAVGSERRCNCFGCRGAGDCVITQVFIPEVIRVRGKIVAEFDGDDLRQAVSDGRAGSVVADLQSDRLSRPRLSVEEHERDFMLLSARQTFVTQCAIREHCRSQTVYQSNSRVIGGAVVSANLISQDEVGLASFKLSTGDNCRISPSCANRAYLRYQLSILDKSLRSGRKLSAAKIVRYTRCTTNSMLKIKSAGIGVVSGSNNRHAITIGHQSSVRISPQTNYVTRYCWR